MSEEEGPRWISPRRYSTESGLGRDQVYALVKEGRIRSLSFGRRLLIPRTELDDFPRRELDAAPAEKNTVDGREDA